MSGALTTLPHTPSLCAQGEVYHSPLRPSSQLHVTCPLKSVTPITTVSLASTQRHPSEPYRRPLLYKPHNTITSSGSSRRVHGSHLCPGKSCLSHLSGFPRFSSVRVGKHRFLRNPFEFMTYQSYIARM
jgi:hypothetical protein